MKDDSLPPRYSGDHIEMNPPRGFSGDMVGKLYADGSVDASGSTFVVIDFAWLVRPVLPALEAIGIMLRDLASFPWSRILRATLRALAFPALCVLVAVVSASVGGALARHNVACRRAEGMARLEQARLERLRLAYAPLFAAARTAYERARLERLLRLDVTGGTDPRFSAIAAHLSNPPPKQ